LNQVPSSVKNANFKGYDRDPNVKERTYVDVRSLMQDNPLIRKFKELKN